jgi:hypothetical protein
MWINDHDEEHQPGRQRKLIAIMLVLALIAAYLWWPSFKTYPEVTSRESLQLMKLLYTACNTQDVNRLNKVEADLQKLVTAKKMTTTEQDAFTRNITLAKNGAWKDAEKASFKFAQDQVR